MGPTVVFPRKIRLSIASGGGDRARSLPKNCHLLPLAAICGCVTVTFGFTAPVYALRLEGAPANRRPSDKYVVMGLSKVFLQSCH
jgi:hypothetical protein